MKIQNITPNWKLIATSFVALFLFVSVTQGQTQDEELSKKELEKIFNLCRLDKDYKLAQYVVYRGDDEARKWKDASHPKHDDEMKAVRKMKSSIKKYLAKGEYTFEEFFQEEESEGVWNVWKVSFNGKPVYFAMLKIKGKYAIGDIDS